ncbi:hypothetical protein WR25_24681 [Diploscapter pachys]|uniref:Secreted protein n=1 Tax=Diploscapter pachys TaxID=2018661 RepID=A0A2A2KC15_9BILA|nr:hypothetical protein WR25_24681 [Diploscapter pachys]
MPSLALRMPWFMPRICAVIVSEIAMPAASSFAELMRCPVDRRSIDVCSAWLAAVDALAARIEATLVPITAMRTSIGLRPVAASLARKAEPSWWVTAGRNGL